MAAKKTEGVLRAEAAAVGLEMLRAPSNAHSKGVYRCLLPSCGWEGEKTAHGVWRGTGCLRCTGQENKKMEAQYLADARAVGLEMLRAPLHSKDRGLYRCRGGWGGREEGKRRTTRERLYPVRWVGKEDRGPAARRRQGGRAGDAPRAVKRA